MSERYFENFDAMQDYVKQEWGLSGLEKINFIPVADNIYNVDVAGNIEGWIEATQEAINDWYQSF